MEKERRKVQMFTAEQVQGLRTYLAQKETEPPPHPETFMMGEIVRAVYPELRKLRESGYSLKVLVRVLEEKGVVCRNLNQRALNLPDESGTNKRRDGAKSGL